MGIETRRAPKPPAATDDSTTDVGTAQEDVLTSGLSGEEVGTELSRRTDQTHWSIPEDGSPVDILIPKKRGEKGRGTLTRGSSKSQTSLLIEYFEGGKGSHVQSRPSVRVKVTPSAARKIKDTNERIRVSESKSGRKPSYTKRIPLVEASPEDRQSKDAYDDESLSGSYTSAAEQSSLAHRYPPVEVEVMRGDGSDLSGASDQPTQPVASDVSSMPPDSMLEETRPKATPKNDGSRRSSKDAVVIDTLKTPSRTRSRSVSKERLAQKAMEKLTTRAREASGGGSRSRHEHSKARSRSVSNETLEKPRRRSSRHHEESDVVSGADSSLVSKSTLSPQRHSVDRDSYRSGTSSSSINANPKLLETVENAIRRLILPEIENMRQEQKMSKNRSKFEQDSLTSTGSGSRTGEITRKLSKHASAPDVSSRPKVVLNSDEHSRGVVLSGDSIRGKKERRRSRKSDSPSERSFERGLSEETVIRDGDRSTRRKSKDGHRLRDAAAGGIAGGILTAAALSHHDREHSEPRSGADRRERRKRRSKSHSSRGGSIAETDEIFYKHDVPPMPMRSDIHSSDITRDSLLSERTEALSTATEELRVAEVQHVTRGSPREIFSPAVRTPTRSPKRGQNLANQHSDGSKDDLTPPNNRSAASFDDQSHSKLTGAAALGAAAGVGALAAHELSKDKRAEYQDSYHPTTRGLSPIQSVSSRQESETNRDSLQRAHSSDSIDSLKQKLSKESAASAKSLSIEDVRFDHSNRPKGMSFEPPEEILDAHRLRDSALNDGELSDKDITAEEWLQREHEKNDRYRDSMEESSYRDSTVDYNRMTNYTDDSLDAPHLDKLAAAQELQGVAAGRNPDFRSTPVAVESAVASLHDPSILSVRSKNGERDHSDSQGEEQTREMNEASGKASESGSKERPKELKGKQAKRLSASSAKESPRHSIARSTGGSESVPMGASGLPVAGDPLPEIGYAQGLTSESEISTNPSIIRGPMGGAQPENSDHWPYQPTPTQPAGMFSPQSQHSSAHESLDAAAEGFLGTALLASHGVESPGEKARDVSSGDGYNTKFDDRLDGNHDFGQDRDSYMKTQPIPSPPRDEGYVSGPHRGTFSPTKAFKDAESWSDGGIIEDPFTGNGHVRHLSTNSGLAHGMGSPLYDGATGEGIDRIFSKDIVALMDHVSFPVLFEETALITQQLTVRDAQRNARDTEILVTLVRSAAEMRNSFEEMKKFIAEQDDILVEASNKQHDRTIQKIIIGGPRPQPGSLSKRGSAEDDRDDSVAKRRNVFRRALRGLGGRNSNDITRIEERLEQLLGEVQSLKNGQDIPLSTTSLRNERSQSLNNLLSPTSDAHLSGNGSTGHVGRFSSPSRGPSAMRGLDSRHASANRVSTVLEADEELEGHDQDLLDQTDPRLLTPTRERRAESVPAETPPQIQLPTGALSNEHTPKTSTEKSRKHKSTSSSFGPKVSRWSKTTASSIGDHIRNGARRDRPYSEASRSGEFQHYDGDHYSPQGDDRLRSNESFQRENADSPGLQEGDFDEHPEDRAPSPLIPSQVSEDPKYQAVRNSVNLQHPQPRPGPTHRYQHHLETQAQQYSASGSRSPISPTSDTFGSDPALARYMPVPGQRYSGNAGTLSPISDAGYSEHSASEQAAVPPRPPKVKDEGPLIQPSTSTTAAGPPRPPKLAAKDNRPTFSSPLSSERLRADQRYSGASASNELV